jgi:non-ribosomal peptide synthetase component F
VNWLPVRADFSDNPTFDLFLGRWEQSRLAALQHQSTPFDLIARATASDADLSRHPLFQHMSVSHVAARKVHFDHLAVSLEPLPTGTSKVDMTVFITDSARGVPIEGCDGILLEIEYSAQLFRRATIQAFGEALVTLLNSATATPMLPVAELRLIEERAVARQLSSGGTPSTHSSPLQLILECVRRHADRPAIVAGDRVVSYADLGARAGAIAAFLRNSGIERGDRVALFLPRAPDLVAAIVGVLMRHAVFVPLDNSLPAGRLAAILEDADPAAVLTTANLADTLRPFAAQRISLIEEIDGVAGEATDGGEAVHHALPAYLIYTSGSTGKPKGVFGAHGPLVNFLEWLNSYLDCTERDRVLCKTPVSFDASLREILAPLCAGATLVLADDDASAQPYGLAAIIADEAVTIVHGTPTAYREMLAAARDVPSTNRRWPTLRHVMCGGEVLNAALVRMHFATVPM